MGRKCALCERPYEEYANISFFRVPKDGRQERWKAACDKEFRSGEVVCEQHFLSTDFMISENNAKKRILPSAVPSVNLRPVVKFVNEGTQTVDGLVRYMENENQVLKDEIQRLKEKVVSLEAQLDKSNSAMKSIFTDGQIRKLIAPDRIVHWSSKDISEAHYLYEAGPKAYNHLRTKGFPLPDISTLNRWARKVKVSEGVLNFSIEALRDCKLSENDKICILCVSEIKVVETSEHSSTVGVVRGPLKYVQMVIARGLKLSWKQPVFYSFNTKMSKDIIFTIVSALRNVGSIVVGITTDMGPTNRTFWKDLNVSFKKPWFSSPVDDSEKVFVFADVPHLLELIRNHFLDTGIIFNNTLVTTRSIVDVMRATPNSDISIMHKLTEEHLSVQDASRQKKKLAAELFSNTTAKAILHYFSLGQEVYQPLETAAFIQLVNDWFDIHNSKIIDTNTEGKEPYGKNLSYQDDVLHRMNGLMLSNIVPNKKALQPLQIGVLISNTALQLMYKYVNEKFGMDYILTNRLNQDSLETFFEALRSKSELNDPPTPIAFAYRLRKYVLGNVPFISD